MPPIPPQPVQINCPACGTPFRTGLFTVVDVGEQPELKPALMSGQLNLAVCPRCGTGSMLSAPLVYHDAAKQLCLVYFPQELTARPEEQERFVGEVTSVLMRSLPADAPRAYLLSPRRFLTLQTLMDTVLEADGISRETLDAQRRRIDLISVFADALQSEEMFRSAFAEHREELNPEFFATLTAFIRATPPSQADSRQVLEMVLDQLNALLSEEEGGAGEDELEAEYQAALEKLKAASDDEVPALIAEYRHALDYSFFELWGEEVENLRANGAEAEAEGMEARREAILAAVEELDRVTQEMFEQGTALLSEVLSTDDPVAALRERGERVGEPFMLALSANAAAAERANREDLLRAFSILAQVATEIMEERLTPEDRLINDLLQEETPQASTKLLRKNVALIKPSLVTRVNERVEEAEKRGDKATADRLRQIAREAGAMLF